VNLRLSDAQHAELVKAGQLENRSLQREIIHRLFHQGSGAGLSGVDQGGSKRPPVEPPAPGVQADSQARDVQARTIVPGEIKSDFKPERKRK
jgi:hypothetical protein